MVYLSVLIHGRAYQGFKAHYTYDLGSFATEAAMVERVRELRADPVELSRIAGDFAAITSANFTASRATYEKVRGRTRETREMWPVMAGRRRAKVPA